MRKSITGMDMKNNAPVVRGDKAYEFFERAWPEQKVDRDRFLDEFKKRLDKSPYWDELKKMNGWQEESNPR